MALRFVYQDIKSKIEALGCTLVDEDSFRRIYNVREQNTKPMNIIVYRDGNLQITGKYLDKLNFISNHTHDIFDKYASTDKEIILYKIDKHLEFSKYIGTDEAGIGNSFGGICVAGLVVQSKEDVEFLHRCGVLDSKKLTNNRLFQLYSKIISKFKTYYIYLAPNQIRFYKNKFGLNIHNLIYLLHLEVQSYLSEYSGINTLILDGYITRSKKMLALEEECTLPKNSNIYRIPKADEFFYGVSAASIIATTVYRQQLFKLEKDLGIRLYANDYETTEGIIKNLVSLGYTPTNYCKDNRNTELSIRKVLNENK